VWENSKRFAPPINPNQTSSGRNKHKKHKRANNGECIHLDFKPICNVSPTLITNNMVSEASNGNSTQSSIGALAMLGNLVNSA
jgi:hypothetical protein